MLKWQQTVRWILAVVVVACAGWVAVSFRKRVTPTVQAPLTQTDPKAVLESENGFTFRIDRDEERIRVAYKKLLTYSSGESKMMGITVTTERNDRMFTITGDEGQVGERDSNVQLAGHVHAVASDGLELTTDRATYLEAEGIARVPGAAQFMRGRMKGSGTGLNFDKNQNILTIADNAVVNVDADEKGAGAMHVTAGGLEFRRTEHLLRFDRAMKATREHEVIEADTAVAHLAADEQQIEALELRGQSRITVENASAGGLQALSGRDIDIKYAADGKTIQNAVINGDALIQFAGEARQPGRQITASSITVSLAPDGSTPTGLNARENVKLNLPGDQNGVSRTIAAATLDSSGDERKGLTAAHFVDNVQFSEKGPDVNRAARSSILDVALAPGLASIEEAKFTHAVRFVDGAMTATSATAKYVLAKGTLELTGSEPGNTTPHVINDQIGVEASRLDVTLDGPLMKGTGSVKSVLQPKKPDAAAKPGEHDVRVPAMFKQDQPVNVTADSLDYDGKASKALYTGNALLWQLETSIKAATITIDSDKGDLAATAPLATVGVFIQEDKDGKQERVRSRGTAKDFAYRDEDRRATYTGDAHVSGPQGDLTAARIEMFLKESGDELDRVEGYDDVTLRGDTQKTTGRRLTYFGDEGRYLVHGIPVKVVDSCGRETTGPTLTFFRATDRIVVTDDNGQNRTQTKGKSTCPGT